MTTWRGILCYLLLHVTTANDRLTLPVTGRLKPTPHQVLQHAALQAFCFKILKNSRFFKFLKFVNMRIIELCTQQMEL